jgi:hypothetical protein
VAEASIDTRCGRWRVKPFELQRPVLLDADGPLTLGRFLAEPHADVRERFARLDLEQLQRLVLARLRGAPPDQALSLFGEGGYSIADVIDHIERGTSLGLRVIEAERKLVAMLLNEALAT